ncbi:cilia and flagella associated protein 61 [Rhinolophus ferrumequinum]|uniref:Cilia and flagella associated protein 61 n=1 Tax=Rhinolophus ferrumequinum TaxID=59479 RepID=A0A671ELG2_RHIFE|nr:cilia- and flagella-associated protein 61 isoform X1 [Rhinolophus ferrumequinum]XP_032950136.1 cilia- and flagella-associated protein 61 isoform X1 [Rhinolophus ferrumequinum]KAF6284179.1 cilia and flagella associated protein 61 [Rhinolophus ferrumequinum]
MSILTSPRGKVEVVHCRRTESQDVYCIKNLIRQFTQKLFGQLNIIYLLEKANLAITLCNDKEEIMAQATFLDYPNWNVAKQDDWVSVFRELDSEIPCTPLNTLFMHLFVAVNEYSVGCCKEIIRTVFKAVPELHFIFLIVPSYISLGSTLITVFDLVGDMTSLTYDEDFAVHVCHRHNHYPQLHIRKARVEDHDDLMPIFMHHNTFLKATYGDYFLAELIEAQDEENHAVVCEVEGVAVGFMSVCSRVNMQLLHECFDLGPFHGLCTPHPDDVLEPPQELSVPGSQDAERRSSSQDSQKIVEEPQEPVSPEARESENNQGKTAEEAATEELSSIVQSGNTSEMEDLENLHQVSTEDDTNHCVSAMSSASISLPKEIKYFRPIYMGASSAFCIQLFCIDEKYEARSLDFMNFVFGLFPDKNFCLISLPHLTPEFVLIQNFVKIVPFNNCTLEQDLYVFHRAGLLKTINIRLANLSDTPGVENLVSTLMVNKRILEDLKHYNEARRDPDGTPLQAFVADVAEQIVGIAVIRNEMDVEYIRSHYNIEDFIYFNHHQREEHGHLYHFALNPIFRHYARFFLKEILRLGYKSCLYYPIYPESRESKFQSSYAHSLTSALHYLVPVRPRRQIVYPLEKLGINAPSKAVSKAPLSYALNHTNRKLTLEPKITVNARIVVVGASSVGLSFLETLVFCSHLKFSNLTLISTHGLPGKKLLGTEQRKFLACDHCFNDKDHALMSLCSWVNVVVGRMTAIDRAAKRVVVSQEEIVLYDHLILCTGQQYQVPCPTGADISQLLTNREIPNSSKQRYTGKVPCNHFTLNDEEDCLKALTWIRNNSIIIEGNVIVYGDTIDTYTTVEVLLNLGMKGSSIYLVQPPPTSTITCINNYSVESAVEDALRAAGVTIYQEALLAQWNDGQNPDPIHSASFTTPTKPFKLPCSLFFSFFEKSVDYETFKAINDACLVYDGRLVIDVNFQTNDVAIRAAGSLTKFSNRYYSNEWSHSSFSSKEIGFQLAAAMLNLFDPTLEPVTEPPADLDRLIPMYKGAKIQGGVLPGSYHYLHITKPAIQTSLKVQMAQPDFGSEIVTGNAKDGTYFRIHINKYKMVETITCLSKEPFPSSNYIRLFGQHEQVLNNLCARYEDKLITDLYSYFTEPWCMALFHDRFIDLRKELRQILTSKEEEEHPSMEQLARQIDDEINLNENPRKYLRRVFQETIYKTLVEKSILDYLHYNHYHLPMYAWPDII